MANKKSWLGISVIILVFGLFLSGCATNVATSKGTNFEKRPIDLIGVPKYTVLGVVTLEKSWFGILGFTVPSVGVLTGGDFYFYQSGGITYVDLLTEAKAKYPDADAVVDIKADYSGSHYAIFYGSRKNIFSGIAIKYSRDVVDYPPQKK